ncbi:ATP-binding cassette domain-containing protein [Listeria seeligeri]|uniref:ABC transporter ATP-binding protein n=1 Tax=Listeria seeligeri TaxID=1640 RepID=UPI0016272C50|nr:ATP-binding cassette domain-containing protein [Listeria seeligeri]MBC1422912.1 ATP-binding cassette domain-containing protein [Listeria seeligeri]MBC1752677.1 ATP-binding cassette domain-containing protein [Listeria seeligeri]MBC1755421.1 ATP-binding cassette domain-containing protein [Listeria seeligeri]MBC1789032.1 ATP-binding cassette domain-containing protein [Listeria seeligeri]MBC1825505.1 ATP-binding cassette domain-containing protein [Listeria seeligeri]
MIEINNLSKKFDERIIFDNFSYSIKQGEFIIFSGASGSGKTTLLNMVGGIEQIDAGEISIDGLNLSKSKDIITIYREKIGFLFQNFALVENKTVEENIHMIDKKYRNDVTVASVLDTVGLSGYEKRKVFTLSGGEQQRVAIARLFMKKCTIVLADEPTGSLDRNNADIVMGHIMELNKLGKTILMVTHDEKLKQQGGRVIEL